MILEGMAWMLCSGGGKSEANSAFAYQKHMSLRPDRTRRVRLTVPRGKMTKSHLPSLVLCS